MPHLAVAPGPGRAAEEEAATPWQRLGSAPAGPQARCAIIGAAWSREECGAAVRAPGMGAPRSGWLLPGPRAVSAFVSRGLAGIPLSFAHNIAPACHAPVALRGSSFSRAGAARRQARDVGAPAQHPAPQPTANRLGDSNGRPPHWVPLLPLWFPGGVAGDRQAGGGPAGHRTGACAGKPAAAIVRGSTARRSPGPWLPPSYLRPVR